MVEVTKWNAADLWNDGLITINQVRVAFGDEPLGGSDKLLGFLGRELLQDQVLLCQQEGWGDCTFSVVFPQYRIQYSRPEPLRVPGQIDADEFMRAFLMTSGAYWSSHFSLNSWYSHMNGLTNVRPY